MSGGLNLSVSVEMHKIDGDPAATDGQVPDAPARPMMEENAVSNKRDQHLPPEVAEPETRGAMHQVLGRDVGGAAR